MNQLDHDYLRKFLKDRSGLDLAADKQYLLERRLAPVVQRLGLGDLTGLIRRLRSPGATALGEAVIEAMTTNESYFFRDQIPFENFSDVILPALVAARAAQRRIRIWCAAASTGQEPYSLAMCVKEFGTRLAGCAVEIVATDISREVLAKAASGVYSTFEVQRGLASRNLVKYFRQSGDMWQISPEIRAMVQFRPFNLLDDFAVLGKFDLVFCRNVLIYFDQATKTGILKRVAACLPADGFLVLGAAETVVGLATSFVPMKGRRGLFIPDSAIPAKPVSPVFLAAAAVR